MGLTYISRLLQSPYMKYGTGSNREFYLVSSPSRFCPTVVRRPQAVNRAYEDLGRTIRTCHWQAA